MEADKTSKDEEKRCFTIKKFNNSATVHVFGATLLSWNVNGREMLFYSNNARFRGKEITNGGIPLVFPVFGPWGRGRPAHGFAGISCWTVKSKRYDSVTLILRDSPYTRMYWNYEFEFEYTVSMTNNGNLVIDITITNTGDEPFAFSFLLHNYFSVNDITRCRISGLKGCNYVDKNQYCEEYVEDREEVDISEYTDRTYFNTRVLHRIKNISSGRQIVLEKMNLPDTIVWNPWVENAKTIAKFEENEWKIMISVGSGHFYAPKILKPGNTLVASQIMCVENL